MPDEKIISGCEADLDSLREGDTRAFKHIHDLYFSPVCYFVQKLIGDKEQAQDIAADAFMKCWLRRSQFNTLENIKAFLYITARNASLDHLKHLKRKSSSHKDLLYLAEKSEDFIQSLIIKTEIIHRIYREIDVLPDKYRNVIRLAYIEGLSYAEIADRLGLPIHNVRVQKSRGIRLLRAAISKMLLMVGVITFW